LGFVALNPGHAVAGARPGEVLVSETYESTGQFWTPTLTGSAAVSPTAFAHLLGFGADIDLTTWCAELRDGDYVQVYLRLGHLRWRHVDVSSSSFSNPRAAGYAVDWPADLYDESLVVAYEVTRDWYATWTVYEDTELASTEEVLIGRQSTASCYIGPSAIGNAAKNISREAFDGFTLDAGYIGSMMATARRIRVYVTETDDGTVTRTEVTEGVFNEDGSAQTISVSHSVAAAELGLPDGWELPDLGGEEDTVIALALQNYLFPTDDSGSFPWPVFVGGWEHQSRLWGAPECTYAAQATLASVFTTNTYAYSGGMGLFSLVADEGDYQRARVDAGRVRYRRAHLAGFGDAVNVLATAGPTDRQPRMAQEPGGPVHLTFRRGANVMRQRSWDGGRTWEDPTVAFEGGRHGTVSCGFDGMLVFAAYVGGELHGRTQPAGAIVPVETFVFLDSEGNPLEPASDTFHLAQSMEGSHAWLLHVRIAGEDDTSDWVSQDGCRTWERLGA
jgi:hypothetical protein